VALRLFAHTDWETKHNYDQEKKMNIPDSIIKIR